MLNRDGLCVRLMLNGNEVVVDWNNQPLQIFVNGSERSLSEDDLHTILRAVNEVRREGWKHHTKVSGSSSIPETNKNE